MTFRAERPELKSRIPVWLRQANDWRENPVVGRRVDTLADVRLAMRGYGLTLVAGQSGLGKTWAVRIVTAWLKGIPGAEYVYLDGKPEHRKDGWFLRHAVDKYVPVVGAEGATRVMDVMEAAHATMLARRDDDRDDPPPFFIHYEEIKGIRTTLEMFSDDALTARYKRQGGVVVSFYRLMAELVQRGRSQNFHSLLIAQQPNAALIPTAIRDMATTAMSFYMPHERASMVFSGQSVSEETMATIRGKRGQALMAVDEGEPVRVCLDYLPDATNGGHPPVWEDLCGSWPTVNPDFLAPTPQDGPVDVQDAPAAPAPVTLESEYRRIVTRPMLVSELRPLLVDAVRPGSDSRLSRELGLIGVVPDRGSGKGAMLPVLPSVLPSVCRQ